MTWAVLLVEDDNDIAAVYSELFAIEGYRVRPAHDGRQALAIVQSQPIDLVISDIRMPQMDGIDMATEIRALGFAMPIVLVSAAEPRSGIGHLASITFLKKPISLDLLVDTVSDLLAIGDSPRSGSHA